MSQALYTPGTPDTKLALFGVSAADFDETVEIFPENWPSFLVMEAMGTQWRTGMTGATGLDYAAVPVVMNIIGIAKKNRNQVFHDVRVMEAEALAVMGEARENRP